MKWFLILLCVFVLPVPSRADHDLDIYSFNQVFVFDVFENQKRVIKFVPLSEDTLKVVAEFAVETQWPLLSYAHHEHFLLVAFPNRVEVYNVLDRRAPKLAQTLWLNKKWDWPRFGNAKIFKFDARYFVMSRKGVVELIPPQGQTPWQVVLLKERPETNKDDQMDVAYPPHFSVRYPWPYVVQETKSFRYLIEWDVGEWKRGKSWGNARKHHKYLSKVSVENGERVSRLLLGEVLETAE